MHALVQEKFQGYQSRIERVLDDLLPSESTEPTMLHQSMRYSVLDGGKRVRALLVYATAEALGLDIGKVDVPAAAIEFIHAYSLIHDDLPAMDDDTLRRGKYTNHIAFDEATAILAGDALQALAFQVVATHAAMDTTTDIRLKVIEVLAKASGSFGMVGGQAIDLGAVGKRLTESELETMHLKKTGALIRASVLMAAHCVHNISSEKLQQLDNFARCIGLAFQVQDDILDIESDTEVLGKTQGADIAANKPTYPSIIGIDAAKQKAEDLYVEALESLDMFGESASLLREIAQFTVKRSK